MIRLPSTLKLKVEVSTDADTMVYSLALRESQAPSNIITHIIKSNKSTHLCCGEEIMFDAISTRRIIPAHGERFSDDFTVAERIFAVL